MRFFKYLAPFVAILGGILYFAPTARLFALVVMGRSPHCPMERALESSDNWKQQIAVKDRILAASRKVETDADGFMLWETPHGRYWIPPDNQWVLPFNLAEQERGIYFHENASIRQGDVVLDCGANVGVFAREALRREAGVVVAIEPSPVNIECLRRNFRREIEAGRVIVYPKGVWDQDAELTLHTDPHNSAADTFVMDREDTHEAIQIPVTTIDKLVGELELGRVDFIKMDIEGAEVRALRGARQTLAKFRPKLALSVYHEPTDPVEVPKAVYAAWDGYRQICGPCLRAGWRIRPDVFFFY